MLEFAFRIARVVPVLAPFGAAQRQLSPDDAFDVRDTFGSLVLLNKIPPNNCAPFAIKDIGMHEVMWRSGKGLGCFKAFEPFGCDAPMRRERPGDALRELSGPIRNITESRVMIHERHRRRRIGLRFL